MFKSLLVKLGSFTNLKYLTYRSSGKDFVLPCAVRQIEALSSTCDITRVCFDIKVDHEHQLDQDICRMLDSILAGEKFPSLQNVGLHGSIPPELFPMLNEAKRLFILEESSWIGLPIGKDDKDEVLIKGNVQHSIEVEE